MKRWEYSHYVLENGDFSFKEEEYMNRLGKEGWELVTSINEKLGIDEKICLIFKREAEDTVKEYL